MTLDDPQQEARLLLELDVLASRFHPRHLAQFAAGLIWREARLKLAQEQQRARN